MGMKVRTIVRGAILGGLVALLSGCGGIGFGDSGLFGRKNRTADSTAQFQDTAPDQEKKLSKYAGTREMREERGNRKIWDLFTSPDANETVAVNKYLWQASKEVLNFLPVQSVDPFSGVLVTGYGTPPGGGRAYRATVYVTDPALDARSLKVALATKGGPVDAATQRAVEDAILTRARQLRVQDSNL